MIEILQGKSKAGDKCKVQPSLFADVSLHSVFIDCFLEFPAKKFWEYLGTKKHTCQKRQEESEGYCDNSENLELLYPGNPPYDCGVYSSLFLLHPRIICAILIFS